LTRRRTADDEGAATIAPSAQRDDLFREVNERIVELGRRFGVQDSQLELLCECEDGACTERVSISPLEYGEVRLVASRHIVVPGHEPIGRGRVVERRAGYVVVED
jgi:hypothetical protein